jgi:hypothetical protein
LLLDRSPDLSLNRRRKVARAAGRVATDLRQETSRDATRIKEFVKGARVIALCGIGEQGEGISRTRLHRAPPQIAADARDKQQDQRDEQHAADEPRETAAPFFTAAATTVKAARRKVIALAAPFAFEKRRP